MTDDNLSPEVRFLAPLYRDLPAVVALREHLEQDAAGAQGAFAKWVVEKARLYDAAVQAVHEGRARLYAAAERVVDAGAEGGAAVTATRQRDYVRQSESGALVPLDAAEVDRWQVATADSIAPPGSPEAPTADPRDDSPAGYVVAGPWFPFGVDGRWVYWRRPLRRVAVESIEGEQ